MISIVILLGVLFNRVGGFNRLIGSTYKSNEYVKLQGTFRDNSFITPLTKERLEKGLLTPREVDKIFNPSKHEVDSILKISSSGFAGVIISLETALVDIRQLCGYSYALLAGELSQATPNPKKVHDIIGSSFKTAVTSFCWDIDMNNLETYENRYYEILNKLLDMMPIDSHMGAVKLINELVRNGDQITVTSAFPRQVAVNVLKKASLSQVFEGRVPAENLVTRDDTEQLGEGYSGQRIIQCCGLMRSPTMLAVYIDANRRNVLAAKRDGLGVIALQGYTENPLDLKAADLLAPNIDSLTCTSIYKTIRHRIEHSEAGGQQTNSGSVMQRKPPGVTTTTSPIQRPPPGSTE